MTGSFLLLVLLAAAMHPADSQPADSQTICTAWDKTEFDEARADWSKSASACYTFSYTFSDFSGGEDAKAVVVRDDVVVSGEGDKTINDFFDLIDKKCADSCQCVNTYAGVGYPLKISIDESEVKVGEELIYTISKYEAVECNSIPLMPTEPPTEAPTEAPTEPPTEAPTEAPTEPPTEAPTEPPTKAPTEPPTEAPIDGLAFTGVESSPEGGSAAVHPT
jgi:cell division septation protein DedD